MAPRRAGSKAVTVTLDALEIVARVQERSPAERSAIRSALRSPARPEHVQVLEPVCGHMVAVDDWPDSATFATVEAVLASPFQVFDNTFREGVDG